MENAKVKHSKLFYGIKFIEKVRSDSLVCLYIFHIDQTFQCEFDNPFQNQ